MLNSDMISVSVLAAQSGLSDRRIRTLCQQGRILGASLIGGVWMLPPNAKLPERVNGRPRKVSPRVAPKAQPVSLSQKLQLSFPYDWSNPEIGTEALIINVLMRGIFEDVSRVCIRFGMDAIERARSHLPVDEANDRSLSRMLRNIVIGMERGAHATH